MNQKGSTNAILVVLVIVLLLTLGYVTLYKKPIAQEQSQNIPEQISQTNKEVNQPTLTENEANALVKSKWGDCTPDTCSNVTTSVSKDGSTYIVTATYEGLRDDSSSAQKKEAVASFIDGAWTLGTPTITQRCQPGRGHQDFSAELCF